MLILVFKETEPTPAGVLPSIHTPHHTVWPAARERLGGGGGEGGGKGEGEGDDYD